MKFRVATMRGDEAPPTKANWVNSPVGSPDFRMWELCQTMPLVSGFSWESPIFPILSFQCCSILISIAPSGSHDLAIKSRLNLFTIRSLNYRHFLSLANVTTPDIVDTVTAVVPTLAFVCAPGKLVDVFTVIGTAPTGVPCVTFVLPLALITNAVPCCFAL
ncbi:hypothetical protein PR048_022241 [Dryococelus australis]|uniref:Uncharacterized protein n=1 Tax=Dryococelus australis TaxID=614101 RepID=A0ABQ9H0F7_9NEOP|nr:hypothetical protein PR048_022241 [Dryococelus australis]